MEQSSCLKNKSSRTMNLLTLDEATRTYLNLKINECRFWKIKKNRITEHLENKVLKNFFDNNKM